MKKIKGFTLIELIIVMAILSILMVGIMQMMKPIRNTFIDSTYYESQRNTQNGIATYIGESIRYATNIGVYTEGVGSITSLASALSEFETMSEVTDKTKYNVIVIDNKTAYKYNNEDCHGRVLRSKSVSEAGAVTTRLALGDAYYGKYTYSIGLKNELATGATIPGMSITVSSLVPSSLKQAKSNGDNNTNSAIDGSSYKFVKTEVNVPLKNLEAPINGKSDFSKLGTTTTSGKNTYIVFTLPET